MKYVLHVLCQECGRHLNQSKPMEASKMVSRWNLIIIGAPLQTKPCAQGCRSTESDMNANTKLEIREESTGKAVTFEALRKLVRK